MATDSRRHMAGAAVLPVVKKCMKEAEITLLSNNRADRS
jgi:hypothetical protein